MERSLKHDVIIVRSKKEVSTSAVCSYFLVFLCLSVSVLMFFFVIFNDVIIVRTKTEVSTSAVCSYFLVLLCLSVSVLVCFCNLQ